MIEVITEDFKKKMLSNATYHLTDQQPFYGNLLQEINVKYTEAVPTAGITYNLKSTQYEVFINPYFFRDITPDQRVAVFHHEILHFTNKHLFRFPFLKNSTTKDEMDMYNIAGDMAINQFIKNLPDGCVNISEWKLDNGDAFPTFKTMEQYYELIKDELKNQQESEDNKKSGNDPGETEGKPRGNGNVLEKFSSYTPFDVHEWDSLSDETKQQMLEEARKLIKRSIEKTSHSYTVAPDSIKDLLVEIEHLASSLNYKAILKSIIKKTVSCVDRESTWKKPNKRYGVVSPGSKVGSLPALSFYLDSSGSISLIELNEFLSIMSNFLKVGTRQCVLGLWHTDLYYKKKYKLHTTLDEDSLQSGGTDITSVICDIKKTKPNLAIILTDMYFDDPDFDGYTGEVLFIVSKDGNKHHGFKLPNTCKVIHLEHLM